jgi:membrane protease YdiL (CAAX protease family)
VTTWFSPLLMKMECISVPTAAYHSWRALPSRYRRLRCSPVPASSIITHLAAVGIVGFAALRTNWRVGDYLALSSLPRASTALIAVLGQIVLFLIMRDFDLSSLARLTMIDTSFLLNVELWLWLFLMIIVGPISEEIVFRGFMFRRLAQSTHATGCGDLDHVDRVRALAFRFRFVVVLALRLRVLLWVPALTQRLNLG